MMAQGDTLGIGQVNYAQYQHAVCQPGPVLSSKTGKQYVPQLSELGKKKPPAVKKAMARQSSHTG